jgi:poly(3-hydroxybutyrate) depolymerase
MFKRASLYGVAIATLMSTMGACSTAPAQPVAKEVFMEREVRVSGTAYRYRVFVPTAKKHGERPVVVFLHGSGERGDDNRKQLAVGLGPYVEKHANEFPAIVVFPQAPENSEWHDNLAMTLAAVDAATREFGGDPDRTYLTGMSMGGYGTWEFALREPRRFAALVPVCGGIVGPDRRPTLQVTPVAGVADPFAEVARRLHDVPVWIFHGARDDVVPAGAVATDGRRIAGKPVPRRRATPSSPMPTTTAGTRRTRRRRNCGLGCSRNAGPVHRMRPDARPKQDDCVRLYLASNASRAAIRTVTPLATWRRISDCGPSATSSVISTPAVHRPGMASRPHPAPPRRSRDCRQPIVAVVVIERGDQAVLHALALDAQHHHRIDAFQRRRRNPA